MFLDVLVTGFITGAGYALLASGLTLIYGVLHIVNFGHGIFYTLGAYVAFYLMTGSGIPYPLAAVLSLIIVGLFSYLVSRSMLVKLMREPPALTMILTWAIAIAIEEALVLQTSGQPVQFSTEFGQTPFPVGGIVVSGQKLITLGTSILFTGMLYLLMKRTLLGKQLQAMAQDFEEAQLVGVNTKKMFNVTFALGGILAAAAGVSLAALGGVINPSIGHLGIFRAFIVVILGGMGSMEGALIAGIMVGLAESFGGVYISGAFKAGFGYLLVMVLLIFRPRGLLGEEMPTLERER